ncbi:MAG TPA: ATP-binding cassette domain-containing protein, partial [Homoserinimonas sp.]|nr:ATP-binding cassette domain-containing protein [Homoserinimonas sp.]
MSSSAAARDQTIEKATALRTAATAPAVMMDAVAVTFPRRTDPVLRDVSLRLAPGEMVIIFAPSGAGKSTLLRTLTGVIPHSVVASLAGTVEIFERSTAHTEVVELSRHISVLSQDPGSALCLPDVEQELALPLENRGIDPREISGTIDTALEAVGASGLRTRKTAQLSGGEAQRIALAACLIAEQAILLLDEPTSMLDARGITSVREAIASAVATYRPAVLLVEHRVDEFAGSGGLDNLPARAIVLGDDGRILADGPTRDVLRDTAHDLHVAGCWLPLDAELQAVFGLAGGLESAGVREGLSAFAAVERPESDSSYGEVVLSTAGLSVGRTGERALISNVDLEIRRGEIIAVLGANGIGKSSLLLTLAGLLAPDFGEVSGARPGMVFQNPEHQFVSHTVRGEIDYGLPADSAARVTAALAQHRLTPLAEQNPFRLSGGEKRRVSLAAMLVHDRPTLLADEPTFGLDRRATIGTIDAFRTAARHGKAIVFSSHDLRTVASLAHRVVVIGDGTIVADGPVFTVFRDQDVLGRAGIHL